MKKLEKLRQISKGNGIREQDEHKLKIESRLWQISTAFQEAEREGIHEFELYVDKFDVDNGILYSLRMLVATSRGSIEIKERHHDRGTLIGMRLTIRTGAYYFGD